MNLDLKRKDNHQLKLRLDDDLHSWVKKTAQDNDRSMTYIIQQAIKLFKKQQEI